MLLGAGPCRYGSYLVYSGGILSRFSPTGPASSGPTKPEESSNVGPLSPRREVGPERYERGQNMQDIIPPVERQETAEGGYLSGEYSQHEEHCIGDAKC